MFRRIYLDNSATTPIDGDVVEAMLPFLTEKFGNASSIHFFGQEARAAIDKARHQAAALVNARPNEIIFTSGGTEANNLAIRGLAEANEKYGKHIITSVFEHSAVKNVSESLEKRGFEVTYLPVYEDGIVKLEDVKNAVRNDTILITIMTANNEIGTLQPVEEIGKFVAQLRETGKKIWFHTDAVQAAGKIELDVQKIGCDLLTISAHKIYAPKGVGALYAARSVRLQNQNLGGHQERERRGGTESVPLIVAFGKACELAKKNLYDQNTFLENLRDDFETRLKESLDDVYFNGKIDARIPTISNISLAKVEGEALLINLDMIGIAVSSGSACSSGSLEPSPVIRALGRSDELSRSSLRISFGKYNTRDDVDYLIEKLPAAVETLRKMSPK